MKRRIISAEDIEDTRFADNMSILKDDFNYLVDSFEKLQRDGEEELAIQYQASLIDSIQSLIGECASDITDSIED